MSIKCMTRVWEYSQTKGSLLLLLLAIADYAHDDGTGAYPSLETLAAKTRMTVQNVIRLVNAAEKIGELQIDRGSGRGNPNQYTVLCGRNTKKILVKKDAEILKKGAEILKPALVQPVEPSIIEPIQPSIPSSLEESSMNAIYGRGGRKATYCDECHKKIPYNRKLKTAPCCGRPVIWDALEPQTPMAIFLLNRHSDWEGFKSLSQKREWEKLESETPKELFKAKIEWAVDVARCKRTIVVQSILTAVRNAKPPTPKSMRNALIPSVPLSLPLDHSDLKRE